jgi:hypothetical protein
MIATIGLTEFSDTHSFQTVGPLSKHERVRVLQIIEHPAEQPTEHGDFSPTLARTSHGPLPS